MRPGDGGDDGQATDGDGGREGDGDGRKQESPTTVETAVVAASTLFTLALFGYVLWQAFVASTAVAPSAHVVGTTALPDGDVRVEVAVENHQRTGVDSVTVAVHCTSPSAQMTFEHVPVDGRRVGFVVCPPGSGTPEVTVTTWTDA